MKNNIYPKILNMGSGKDFKPEALNIDIEPETNPDVILDLNQPIPREGLVVESRRFGEIQIVENYFEEIHSNDVLEHLVNLTTAMTTCLRLLKVSGDFKINVPYDLSYGAWQDPTHVRAFNERSWLYYTDWFWYLGWDQWRFDLTSLEFILNPIGKELQKSGLDGPSISRTPRAIDSMQVTLRKRILTNSELEFLHKIRTKPPATQHII